MLITLIAAQAKKLENGRYRSFGGSRGAFGRLYAFSPKITLLALVGFSLNLPVLLQGNAPRSGNAIPRPSGVAQQKRWFVIALLTDFGPVHWGLCQSQKVNLGVFCTVTVRHGELLVQALKVVAATCNP
ncbi:hypothetical protein [Serratia fonticola]|uniref:hypothetical protein n=1 Tax=Serratia fonticola TaxID=47917 RepID=UPI00141A2F3F|nr:hypothetical protein [Serratia fonticola]NXZ85931.1 hypothetical protein [Serratia fonticola]